jgi:hypothetical protein
VTVNLTTPEVRRVLWLIGLLEACYSGEAPEGTLVDGLKGKLAGELAHHGQRGITLA